MAKKLRGTFMTGAGMTCLWDPSAFSEVVDFETWEAELSDDKDILRHIKAGAFVPINIQSDGVFEIEVRVGTAAAPAALSKREEKYLVVVSEPYLFRSAGKLCVSGIEQIDDASGDEVGTLALAAGDYAVTIYLIGWDAEPGMRKKDGKPKKEALPDFVALVNPQSNGTPKYRRKLATFPPPGK